MQSAAIGEFSWVFSHVVLLLMAAAIVYAGFITSKYWSGIGV